MNFIVGRKEARSNSGVDIGDDATTLIEYFERNGAPKCPPEGNAAEWMLGLASGTGDGPNWPEIWHSSPEYTEVKAELARLRARSASSNSDLSSNTSNEQHKSHQSYSSQFKEVSLRVSKHFWRSPVYIYSKLSLTIIPSIYLGFSFNAARSLQGLQNQLYSFFMALILLVNFNEQIMPHFLPQRAIYEARERPSRIYHWSSKF